MVTIMHAMSGHDSFRRMTSPNTDGGNSGKGEVCVSVWPFKTQQSPDLPVLTLSVCEAGTRESQESRDGDGHKETRPGEGRRLGIWKHEQLREPKTTFCLFSALEETPQQSPHQPGALETIHANVD